MSAANSGIELLLDKLHGDLVDPLDPQGVLARERRDHGHAEAPQGRDRLQVGLDAGPASGIGSRNRQYSLHFHFILPLPAIGQSPETKRHTPRDVPLSVMIAYATPYAGITQVRFEGYHLSLYGTPRIVYSVVGKAYFKVSPESSKFWA